MCQGPAILSESIRNRDSKVSGIGIGIESCPSLGIGTSIGIESLGFSLVSESILIQSGLVYQVFALCMQPNKKGTWVCITVIEFSHKL